MTDELLNKAACPDHLIEVAAGSDSHFMAHMYEIFCRDVPGRPGGKRASADAGEAGVE